MYACQSDVVATTSLRMTNRPLNKLKSKVSHRDHKRTQQGVLNVFLHYIYWYTWSVLIINNLTFVIATTSHKDQ